MGLKENTLWEIYGKVETRVSGSAIKPLAGVVSIRE
jgi:hypothetical protein